MNGKLHKDPLYISSGADLFISSLVSSIGLLINKKFLNDTNEDEKKKGCGTSTGIVNGVMKLYTKCLMVLQPLYSLLFLLACQDLDLPEWMQYLSCYDQYIAATTRFYVGFNSLVIALMRYTFIVHHETILIFGKDKAKAIFYHGSYCIPIVLGIIHALFVPVPDNAQNPVHSFCKNFNLYNNLQNVTCGDPDGLHDQCSPILSMTHRYVPVEISISIGIFLKAIVFLILSNFLEGILYWRTFNSIKKYVYLNYV